MSAQASIEIVRDFEPVMLPPGTTVLMAARHMHSRGASAVLVTEGDRVLVGIFTERDAISRVLATGRDPVRTTLAEVMTDNPNSVTPDNSISEIVHLMQSLHCRHLPIVRDGKAVGIASHGPLCDDGSDRGAAQMTEGAAPAT